MPYTRAYVSGLRMGLTCADLNSMPFGRLAHMLDAWGRMNGGDGGAGSRRGSQADIDSMLM